MVIVNEAFARRFWPSENPLGKHVTRWTAAEPAEVVGVSADVKNKGLALETQAAALPSVRAVSLGQYESAGTHECACRKA